MHTEHLQFFISPLYEQQGLFNNVVFILLGFISGQSFKVTVFRMEYILGKTHWAIAEGFIPEESNGPEPDMTSHETACVLNTSDQDAHIEIMIYFEDKDPVGPYKYTVPAKRTSHIRFNELKDPEPIPKGTDYASTLISDVPVVVQHSRLDSRQSENALLTTIAYSSS